MPMPVYAQTSPDQKAELANQSLSEWIKFNQQFDNKWKVRWDPHTGLPRLITGYHTPAVQGNAEDIALKFIHEQKPLLQVDPQNLTLEKITKARGLQSIKYRQRYKGIPVLGHRVLVITDGMGQVTGYTSTYDPFIELDSVQPQVSHDRAQEIALSSLGHHPASLSHSKKELAVYANEDGGTPGYHLCWRVELSSPEIGSWLCLVDALTGDVLTRKETVLHSHGHVSGLIFPIHALDAGDWAPLGEEKINFTFGEPSSAVSDFFWGGYGVNQASPFTTSLSGPYVNIHNAANIAAYPGAQFTTPEVTQYAWVEISNPTGTIQSSQYDHVCAQVTLPFSFNFYDGSYNYVYIDSYGFLCFADSPWWEPQPIPSPPDPNSPSDPRHSGIIAPFWRKTDLTRGGKIDYLVTSDKLVVTWDGLHGYLQNTPQTFQAILTPDGKIVFQYKDIINDEPTAIGIQNPGGSSGLGYYEFPSNSTAVLFSSPQQDDPVFPEDPNFVIKSATSFTYSDAPDYDFTYNYDWYEPSTDPNNPSIPSGIIYDDQLSNAISLGFTFPFYGVGYSAVYICSNGYISFSSGMAYWYPDPIPSINSPNNIIAPFFRDLDPSKGGRIFYEKRSDRFIITWEGVPDFYDGEKQTFQAVLYQSGDILFQYKDITGSSTPTAVGVENQSGTIGRPCQGMPTNNSAVKLSPSSVDPSLYEPATYTYSWITTTTPTGITGDDQSQRFDLGFDLDFYGKTHNYIYVCSNGFLDFAGSTSSTPIVIPHPYPPNEIIAPLWRDLDPSAGGQITYLSDPNKFVVTWDHVPGHDSSIPQTFQAIIHKTGLISFQYQDVPYQWMLPNCLYVIELENAGGTAGKTPSNLAVKFTPGDYEAHPCSYRWQETSTATGITEDDQSQSFDLGFTLNFYGQDHNSIHVCSNGFLDFAGSTGCDPDPIPYAVPPNEIIAPFWRALNPSLGGQITYLSDPNRFVVTWDHVPGDYSLIPQTFQAIIYKTGEIIFQYKEIYFNQPTSIGVENQTGTQGTSYFFPLIQFYPRHYTSLVWGFPETSPRADEVNVSYHVNRIHDYIHKTLNISDDPNYTQVTVKVYDPTHPASYEPTDKTIYIFDIPSIIFGDSRESDVIYHEYAHFFQHGIYGQDYVEFEDRLDMEQFKAMTEGYSDYFACTLNDDPNVDLPPSSGQPPRNISELRKYPEDYTPPWEKSSYDPHENGKILSSAFWDIRQSFNDPNISDVDKTDADLLIAHSLMIEPKQFIDMKDWLLSLDGIYYSGNHYQMLENILDEHGIKEDYYRFENTTYSWIDTSSGTLLPPEDNISVVVDDIGFQFNFYGESYSSLHICSNGFLSFTSDSNSPVPVAIPNVSNPNNLVAGLWADIDHASVYPGWPEGHIRYLKDLSSTPKRFIVTWEGVYACFNGIYGVDNAPLTFQIILKEDNTITFQYNYINNQKEFPHSIGIENAEGNNGVPYFEIIPQPDPNQPPGSYALKFTSQ